MKKLNFNAKDRFEIGGEELLISVKNDPFQSDLDTEEETTEIRQFKATLDDIRIRIGTLLKTETVSLLLGAGASVDCGGQLIGSVPLQIEQNLNDKGIIGVQQPRVRQWLKIFYLAVRCASGNSSTPVTRQEILSRREALKKDEAEPLQVNLESVLATLHQWHSVLFETGKRLRVDSTPQLDIKWNELDICLMQVTRALARVCHLPTADNKTGFTSYVTLVRKLLTRPLNLRRVNIFTLNYDTLVEQASDASGVVLLDGFVGVQNRVFRPESYEQDLYFPANYRGSCSSV